MSDLTMRRVSLSSLVGARVQSENGIVAGRIAEFLLNSEETGTHVSSLLLSTTGHLRGGAVLTLPVKQLQLSEGNELRLQPGTQLTKADISASSVLLERDLLDQQIIDVDGHKVVRVNDVELMWEIDHEHICQLRITEVEVGLRGAVRRLLKGLPPSVIEAVAHRFQPRGIPWKYVDLIDRDPARRVRLKVDGDRLSSLHPADIADILEELDPAERDAVFISLDDDVAAEALEEVEPKLQRSLLERMDSGKAADIIEEMDPGAAADLLSELPPERSEAILHEMEPDERADVEELLEFPEDWAAGRMTTDYVAVLETAAVADAIAALRAFEGDLETVSEVFLLDRRDRLTGVVSLARIALSAGEAQLSSLQEQRPPSCTIDANSRQVAELFDKYNLRSLAVLNADKTLAGVIYAEQVIALLRAER